MGVYKNIILLVLILFNKVFSENILFVSPVASPSHHIWNKALALGLVEKGHNVTMLSHETEKLLPSNFTIITMEGVYDILHEVFTMEELADENPFRLIVSMYEYGLFACEYDYNTTGFRALLNYPKDYTFDLIIFDVTIGRCFYPLIKVFQNPPTIAVTPFLLPPVLDTVFGNNIYTSYLPYYNTPYTNKMSLMERVFNFIYTYSEILYRNYIFLPKENAIIQKEFGEYMYSIAALERSISLLLCNMDPILDYPEALPPNIIPVGGLHARVASRLPNDLQKIMDQAPQGVILFSLGTNLRSDKLDIKIRQAFLQAFVRFPQVVLWKYESDDLEGLPTNVITRKWLPQNDILGHTNIKLFINHGGALSTQEAIYHGVPLIGIPFFADQHVNVRKMESKGVAVHLNKDNLTTENIYQAIQTSFFSVANNMKILSKRYHDQPQSALKKGIFWTEYLLRHGNAEHLVSVSRDLSVYQTANIDVLAVFIFGVILIYLALMSIFRCCRFVGLLSQANEKLKKTN